MTTPNNVTAENKDTFPAPQPGPAAPEAEPAQPAAQEATPPPAAQPASNGTDAQGPASYDDLKLPDESQAPQGLLDGFKQLAKELGLPPQAAQRLVDWEFAQAQALGRTQQAKHQEILQGWADASKGQQRNAGRPLRAGTGPRRTRGGPVWGGAVAPAFAGNGAGQSPGNSKYVLPNRPCDGGGFQPRGERSLQRG